MTAGTGEMFKTPIAEGTLSAVETGATADTLARRGIILYYILCISHSRDSWDVNSRKSIGNSMVDSSTRDNWVRECQQRKGRKNCLSTSSRRDVKNSDSLKCLIFKYYSKRRDNSNSRITSNCRIISKNSRNLSNSRNSSNSRDVRKTAGMPITAGTGDMLKTPIAEGMLAAVGTGANRRHISLQRDYTILYSVH